MSVLYTYFPVFVTSVMQLWTTFNWGRAIPIHICVVQGRTRVELEVCNDDAFRPGSEGWWNALKKRRTRTW